jgi:hypothetical protein
MRELAAIVPEDTGLFWGLSSLSIAPANSDDNKPDGPICHFLPLPPPSILLNSRWNESANFANDGIENKKADEVATLKGFDLVGLLPD